MTVNELSDALKLKDRPIGARRVSGVEPTQTEGKGCSLRLLKKVMDGERIVVRKDDLSCKGAKHGFGFVDGIPNTPGGFGKFLTTGAGEGFPAGERLKCSEVVAELMMSVQPKEVLEGFDGILLEPYTDNSEAELVIIPANPDQLAALVQLHSYRKPEYDNVIMPMSSGCASVFRIPFGEMKSGRRRAVIGNVDVFSRPHFDKDIFFFVVGRQSFKEMLADADESFLIAPVWNGIKKRL